MEVCSLAFSDCYILTDTASSPVQSKNVLHMTSNCWARIVRLHPSIISSAALQFFSILLLIAEKPLQLAVQQPPVNDKSDSKNY